jgi:1-acyl-sn-glycerol-3-phosphate acyltransferase
MLKTIFFKLLLFIWFALWSPLLLLALPSRKLTRRAVVADALGVLWLARIIAGIRYKIRYLADTDDDGIPTMKSNFSRADGKAIIAAKHMSILEVAVLATHIPNSFFILKRELMWIPVYGWSFWRMGLQPVNRAKGSTNMHRLAEAVAEKIKSGMTLIIFPEGTRAKPGAGVKLKRGLLFIAEALKLPIIPVGTDSGLYWPKRGKMRSGTANVWFEPLLPSNASLSEIEEAIGRHSA